MSRLIVAVVSLSNTRFQVAAGTREPRRRVEWKVCTEIALSAMLADAPLIGMDHSFLDLLNEAAQTLVYQREVRTLLLQHAFGEAVLLVDPPLKRGCMLWPPPLPPCWRSLLSTHWRAVELVYTHVRRTYQATAAEEMREKQMTASDFFRQFEYRPAASNERERQSTTDWGQQGDVQW
jgi:hypothetical protein